MRVSSRSRSSSGCSENMTTLETRAACPRFCTIIRSTTMPELLSVSRARKAITPTSAYTSSACTPQSRASRRTHPLRDLWNMATHATSAITSAGMLTVLPYHAKKASVRWRQAKETKVANMTTTTITAFAEPTSGLGSSTRAARPSSVRMWSAITIVAAVSLKARLELAASTMISAKKSPVQKCATCSAFVPTCSSPIRAIHATTAVSAHHAIASQRERTAGSESGPYPTCMLMCGWPAR
mmetsp:Transcript_19369/g.60317  ORF Transcript_19369/g.60317 Transcript_19369/m.60317 type:complete len:240 (-) Transcript_19369:125-844(-)